MDILSLLAGVILGGLLSYLITRHFYQKASEDSRRQLDELQRQNADLMSRLGELEQNRREGERERRIREFRKEWETLQPSRATLWSHLKKAYQRWQRADDPPTLEALIDGADWLTGLFCGVDQPWGCLRVAETMSRLREGSARLRDFAYAIYPPRESPNCQPPDCFLINDDEHQMLNSARAAVNGYIDECGMDILNNGEPTMVPCECLDEPRLVKLLAYLEAVLALRTQDGGAGMAGVLWMQEWRQNNKSS